MLEITVTCNGETIKYLASGLPITIKQSELVTVVVNYAAEQTLAPDACPYCLGKGEEPCNKVMVRCRFCAGTGKCR